MKTRLTTLIAMARTRAHRHYLAMIYCERRGEWRQADRHYETLVNCERLETRLVDDAVLVMPRIPRHFG